MIILRTVKFLSVLFLILSLTAACQDMTELNEREFITSVGIDKAEEDSGYRYKISISSPGLGSSNKDEKSEKNIRSVEDETISGAFRKTGLNSSNKPYFGHTKAVVMSRGVLEDKELFLETLDTLWRNGDLSKKIIALAAKGEAGSIVEEDINGADVGVFISDYYKNSRENNGFLYDLGELIRNFRTSGDNLLPEIEVKDGKASLSSAAVIKDYRYAGSMENELLSGFLWVKGKERDMRLTAEYNGTYVPLKVEAVKRKINIEEKDGAIYAFVKIDVKGAVEEYIFKDEALSGTESAGYLSELYKKEIAGEILSAAYTLQKEYNVDAYGLLGIIRKQNYGLYQKVSGEWEEIYKNVEIIPQISVKIKSKGGIV